MSKNLYKTILKHLILMVLLFNITVLQAQDAGAALRTAESFFKSGMPQFLPGKTSQTLVLNKRYQSSKSKNTTLYVFEKQDKGFVIIAQQQGKNIVVGYAPEGVYKHETVPQQLRVLMNMYEDSLSISALAQDIKMGTAAMTPLLDEKGIQLNQFHHENVGYCPSGCIATAFTQIMCYYRYPSKGIGSHCYTHNRYGELCADFGNTTYNWNNPTSDDYNILSYHVGIAMDMNYCADEYGSAPYKWGYEKAMNTYFNYHLRYGSKESYFIKNEIDNKRPVYVELLGDPGHAMVVDGYDENDFFHINFGWGGQYNGYFQLNSNTTFTVGYKFGTNISAAYYISPNVLKTNVQDSLALVAIHNGLGATTGWNLSEPASSWKGVLVFNERVTELNLNNGIYNNLKGTIVPEIGQLTALKKFNLLGIIDGDLPASIYNLSQLKTLMIFAGAGNLKVNLDEKIGQLTNLEHLEIPLKATGNLSSTVGNLTQLKILKLNGGSISGNIPSEIGNLIHLTELSLQQNNLSGPIPATIGNLTQLTNLNLSNNQLSGNIPATIDQLIQLETLLLDNNSLSGEIPSNIGNCNKLIYLNLYDNLLSGAVPESIGELSLLNSLNLSNNLLTALPETIDQLSALSELNLNNNQLTTFPTNIGKLPKLKSLSASHNKINALPDDFGSWPTLETIHLSNNDISVFPDALCQLPKLQAIGFRSNKIKQFPVSIGLLSSTVLYLALDSNEIKGKIPLELLENEKIKPLLLAHNYFTYEDLPSSDKLKSSIGNQKEVGLSKTIFNTALGDTLTIDVRDYAPFKLESNEYVWHSYPQNKALSSSSNPLLTIVVDNKTINNQYYCTVTNPASPTYSLTEFGSTYTFPCLNSIKTETIGFQLATEEELIAEKYNGDIVISTKTLPSKTVEDRMVTLVPPRKVRGKIQWQASPDGVAWHDLSTTMAENDLKSNFVSVESDELILSPKTPAYYRCSVSDLNCEPLYSDTLKVNPFGSVLYDETLNVSTTSKTVSIDSIEVTLPAGIYDQDFRLTIVKLDNPPTIEGLKMSSVYDVTASFGSVFELPIQIKLKNIDKELIGDKELPALKPAYFDEASKQWKFYDNGGVTLKDSTIFFITNHLTKLAWFQLAHGSFTHIHTSRRVNVIYKWGTETGEENNFAGYNYTNKNKTPEAWFNPNTDPEKDGTPMLIQDVAGYMDIIIDKFKAHGLKTPSLRFNVYVSNLGYEGSFGKINAFGYLAGRGYFSLNSALAVERDEMRSTLAHEYMHYTQDYYMMVLTDNYFFTEAHAPLADRLVWPTEDELEVPEVEQNLRAALLTNTKDGASSIFDLLGRPWDYASTVPVIEKFTVNTMDANVSSTFLHYMRSYRKGTKLNIAKLLSNHTWASNLTNWSWRSYINSEVKSQLETTIGSEFDDFVRYLLSGENEKFSVINTNSFNPYTYITRNLTPEDEGTFAKRIVYNFKPTENEAQVNNVDIKVPYLAAKVLLLYNQTPDKAVIVKYKRLHEKDKDHKVYYGNFNFTTKTTEFIDISDSLNYRVFIEARTVKSAAESKNMGFLLLVNQNCPNMISWDTDFAASFELTASPVFDIESLETASITANKGKDLFIHLNSKDNKDAFIVEGVHLNRSSSDEVYHTVNIYNSSKHILNDSTYKVSVFFTDETRTEDGFSLPIIQLSTVQQNIEYNFGTGSVKIHCISTYTNKAEIIENEKPIIKLMSVWNNDTELHIKNINTMQLVGSGTDVLLSTQNTTETRQQIERMTHRRKATNYDWDTGEVSDIEYVNYVSTDYSRDDVTLLVIFRVK